MLWYQSVDLKFLEREKVSIKLGDFEVLWEIEMDSLSAAEIEAYGYNVSAIELEYKKLLYTTGNAYDLFHASWVGYPVLNLEYRIFLPRRLKKSVSIFISQGDYAGAFPVDNFQEFLVYYSRLLSQHTIRFNVEFAFGTEAVGSLPCGFGSEFNRLNFGA